MWWWRTWPPEGKILTLSAQNALEEGYADAIAASRNEALGHFGYAGARVEQLTLGWAEHLARFVTNSVVSSLLLTLGFLGLIFEITTPGWGVPGTSGLICLILFFGGRYLAGLVGIEAIGLFVLGLILLMIETFVLPGFGLVGLLGFVGVAAGIIMAFGSLRPPSRFDGCLSREYLGCCSAVEPHPSLPPVQETRAVPP